MSSWIVTDATTFEMEFCGHTQATAHAHVQPHGVWLNFEHTKNSNPSKKFSERQNSNSNLLINSKNPEIVRIGFERNSTSCFETLFLESLPVQVSLY